METSTNPSPSLSQGLALATLPSPPLFARRISLRLHACHVVVPLLLESPRLDEGGTLLVQGGYFSEEVGPWHQRTSRSNNAHTSCGSSEVVLLGSQRLIGSKPSGSFGVGKATRARAGLRRAALAV